MDYFFRYKGEEHFYKISYAEARTMLKEYCSFKGMQADMTMLDIPNRLDVLTGEMICIGPQGELPLGGHRNMIPDEYYGAAGENGRDPWVDPGKVFLGGLAQFAETEKKRRQTAQKIV